MVVEGKRVLFVFCLRYLVLEAILFEIVDFESDLCLKIDFGSDFCGFLDRKYDFYEFFG